jgi:hypothetical protein
MTNYPNWFAVSGEWYFKRHLSPVEDRRLNALQIGAYTGDATVWLLENYLLHPSSTLTDVDTWKGSDEEVHKSFTGKTSRLSTLIKPRSMLPREN